MTNHARTLVITPANGTQLQIDLGVLCPELAPMKVALIPRSPGMLSMETLPVLESRSLEALEEYRAFEPEVVVFGCTVAGFLSGPERHQKFLEEIRRRSGAKVIGVATAMVDSLRASGVSSVTVVTPYMDEANNALNRYLKESSLEVEAFDSFYPGSVENLMKITEEDVRQKILNTVLPDSKAVFVACAQMPGLNVIPLLRQQLGIPVWSSTIAAAWAAASALEGSGRHLPILDNPGYSAPVVLTGK